MILTKTFLFNFKIIPHYKVEKAKVSTTLLKQRLRLAQIPSLKIYRDLFYISARARMARADSLIFSDGGDGQPTQIESSLLTRDKSSLVTCSIKNWVVNRFVIFRIMDDLKVN